MNKIIIDYNNLSLLKKADLELVIIEIKNYPDRENGSIIQFMIPKILINLAQQ